MKSVLATKLAEVGYGELPSLANNKLKSNEVLIKVEAAALNPSDILFMRGLYEMTPEKYPFTPGWEGSGTVVSGGEGQLSKFLLGKKVAFMRQSEMSPIMKSGGAMAEYCITGNRQVVPLPDELSFEEGASLFVNPLTAICMVDRCAELKSKATIVTAGASAISKMIIPLLILKGIAPIVTVRKQSQVKLVQNLLGPKYENNVFVTSDSDFTEKFTKACRVLRPSTALDSIGGDFTGLLFDVMTVRAHVIIYGLLSDQPAGKINVINFLGKNQRLEAFMLTHGMAYMSKEDLMKLFATAQGLFTTVLRTKVNKSFGLHQLREAISYYMTHQTDGKIVIKPSLTPAGTKAVAPINLNTHVKSLLAKM